VRARFVDPEGAPLAGIELVLAGEPRGARSGADGIARLVRPLEFFDGEARVFEARGAGWARERRSARTPPEGVLLLGDWPLVAGGAVDGFVLGPDGRGLPGVRVACLAASLFDASRSEAGWNHRRREDLEALARPGPRAETDPTGAFALEGVPAGVQRLVAVRPDRPAARSEPLVVLAGERTGGVVLAMEEPDGGTAITGIVLDPAGAAVAGARIEVRARSSSLSMFAGEDGRFRIEVADRERRDLTAFDPRQRLREGTRLGVVPGTRDLELRLRQAPELELRVRASDGTPVERYAVAVLGRDRTGLAFLGEDDRLDGRVRLPVPGQEFFLEVRRNGWRTARSGPHAAEPPPQHLEIVLVPAGGLRGRVTAGGAPVRDALLLLHAAARNDDRHDGFPIRLRREIVQRGRSAPDGTFALSVDEPGDYWLLVEAEGFALAEAGPLALQPDGERVEDVALGPGGTLEVVLHTASSAALEGRLVAFSRGDGRAFTRRADAEGVVRAAGLTPGPWQVECVERELDSRSGVTEFGVGPPRDVPSNCQVVEEGLTRVDLWVEGEPPPCRLRGTLTIDGRPAVGWSAALQEGEAPRGDPVLLDAGGGFVLATTEPGDFGLQLLSGGEDPTALLVLLDQVRLDLGERAWELDFARGTIEGTLREDEAEGLVFFRWRRGTVEGFAALAADAEGRVLATLVPAGEGTLVRLDPGRPRSEQVPVVLGQVRVPAGGVLHLGR